MALTQQVLGKLGCPAMGLTFLMTVLPGIDDLQRGNTACGTAMLAIGTVSLLSFISAKAKQLQYADTLAKMTCTAAAAAQLREEGVPISNERVLRNGKAFNRVELDGRVYEHPLDK